MRRPPRPHRALRLLHPLAVALAVFVAGGNLSAAAAPAARVLEVRKIWDAGKHNAFTDLLHWHGHWWCSFRESEAHVGGDGAIRLLESTDGVTWRSAAHVTEEGIDLRDPKLSITPDDRLMINCGGSVYRGTKQLQGRQSRVLFSSDGRTWTPPARVLHEGEWLWRVTWREGVAYGIAYGNGTNPPAAAGTATEWPLTLYSSRDGLAWQRVTPLAVTGRPNEATVRFLPNGDLVAMVRREAGNQLGTFGVSSPPYQQWTWRETGHRFGGPNFIRASDGSWIVCTRDHTTPPAGATKGVTTVVAQLGADGLLQPLATLPSGGDCSYAGLAWHEGQLWVSYYSSHEGKSAIYLAKLALP